MKCVECVCLTLRLEWLENISRCEQSGADRTPPLIPLFSCLKLQFVKQGPPLLPLPHSTALHSTTAPLSHHSPLLPHHSLYPIYSPAQYHCSPTSSLSSPTSSLTIHLILPSVYSQLPYLSLSHIYLLLLLSPPIPPLLTHRMRSGIKLV